MGWKNLTPDGAPFSNPGSFSKATMAWASFPATLADIRFHADDIKILYNDWPYGIESHIIHLCVWTKFPLPDNPNTGYKTVTPEYHKLIDTYVEKTFRKRVPPEHVIWFKNWGSLKSIHAMEHFHVMLYKPDRDFIKEITNDDVPTSQIV